MKEEKNNEELQQSLNSIEVALLRRGLSMAVSKYKSIKRAIKRGHITSYYTLIADKPFNNRANTSSRKGVHSRVVNELKKRDYNNAKRVAA